MFILEAIAIVVGVVSGVSGSVLGVLNFIHQRDTAQAKLRVRPAVWSIIDRDEGTVEDNVAVVEVANIGHVPVITSTVGFRKPDKNRPGALLVSPNPINDEQWPGKLQPSHVVVLRTKIETLPNLDEVGPMYVKTILGDIFTCRRRDMRKFAQDLASARKNSNQQQAEE